MNIKLPSDIKAALGIAREPIASYGSSPSEVEALAPWSGRLKQCGHAEWPIILSYIAGDHVATIMLERSCRRGRALARVLYFQGAFKLEIPKRVLETLWRLWLPSRRQSKHICDGTCANCGLPVDLSETGILEDRGAFVHSECPRPKRTGDECKRVMYAVEYMDGNSRKGTLFRSVPKIPDRIRNALPMDDAFFSHVPRIELQGFKKELRDCAYLDMKKCWFVPQCCTLEGAILAREEGTTAASAEAAREVIQRTQLGYETYLRALRTENKDNKSSRGKKVCKNCYELIPTAKKICTRCNRDPNSHDELEPTDEDTASTGSDDSSAVRQDYDPYDTWQDAPNRSHIDEPQFGIHPCYDAGELDNDY